MHKGTNLVDMARELERRVEAQRDFVAPVSALEMTVAEAPSPADAGIPVLSGLDKVGDVPLTPWAHAQLAEYLKIPKPYYDRMVQSAPRLLAENVNRWLHEKSSEKRFIRTLDSQAIAWLSNTYRPLSNFDLAHHAIPTLEKTKATVRSCQLTETRLYIKAIVEERTVEVKRGEPIRCGAVIRNSEVGNGALDVALFIEELVCVNGAIAEAIFRKAHLGKKLAEELEAAAVYISDRTRRADDAALWSRFDDALAYVLSQENMDALVERMRGAAADQITAPVAEAVEEVTAHVGLPGSLSELILENLVRKGDLTRYGVMSAIDRKSTR